MSKPARTTFERLDHLVAVAESTGDPVARAAVVEAIAVAQSIYTELGTMMHDVARANGAAYRAQAWAARWKDAAKTWCKIGLTLASNSADAREILTEMLDHPEGN